MTILHDKRVPLKYLDAIRKLSLNAELLPFDSGQSETAQAVYETILHHPDIFFCRLDKCTAIHAPGLPDEYIQCLKESGIETIQGSEKPSGRYPGTAGYNVLCLGKTIFHNLEYSDPVITETARKKGFKLINIKQGYARCAAVIVNEDAVITSDMGIADAVSGTGKDVIRIAPGGVVLPGEAYGFIGGASTSGMEDGVIFMGDIKEHHNAREIERFFSKHGQKYMALETLPLFDGGGLLVI
ncbi:MAG: DUF6873 family GME fold protein [Candidatus Omnitrophota bacterium]